MRLTCKALFDLYGLLNPLLDIPVICSAPKTCLTAKVTIPNLMKWLLTSMRRRRRWRKRRRKRSRGRMRREGGGLGGEG